MVEPQVWLRSMAASQVDRPHSAPYAAAAGAQVMVLARTPGDARRMQAAAQQHDQCDVVPCATFEAIGSTFAPGFTSNTGSENSGRARCGYKAFAGERQYPQLKVVRV